MTIGIILTHQQPLPTEILPVEDGRRLIIDNQLVAMRYGGANDIFVVVHSDQAVFYTKLFSEEVYEKVGIIPRIVSTRLTGWSMTTWAIGELAQPNKTTYLGYGWVITPPTTYERLWLGDPECGLRVAQSNDLTIGGMYLQPEVAKSLAYSASNQLEAYRSVEAVYGKQTINVPARTIYDFKQYVAYIKAGEQE